MAQRRQDARNTTSMVVSAKIQDDQRIPLPQSIHEAPVKVSQRETLGRLLKSRESNMLVYSKSSISKEELGTIRDHFLVFSRRGGTDPANHVFACLNDMELTSGAFKAYEAARLSNDHDKVMKMKNAIRSCLEFRGILQSTMMHTSLTGANRLSQRDIGSAVFGGLFGVYNPFKKAMRILDYLVWDVPDPADPAKDIVQNKQFGYSAALPYLRPFDPQNPYDHMCVAGRLTSEFDGPMMQIQLNQG